MAPSPRPVLLPLLVFAAGCALASVPTKRLFPVLPAEAPNQARLEDGWTVSIKGGVTTAKVNLARAGRNLLAQVEVRNDSSALPLRTAKITAFDKDKTFLQSAPADSAAGAYQDNPIPKGFSNRGPASFTIADRKPPFTVELTVTDGNKEEVLQFGFKEFGPSEFWGDPEMVLRDPGQFFRTLSFEERQEAYNTARKVRRAASDYAQLKTSDPKRFELLEWVRMHEYDIEF